MDGPFLVVLSSVGVTAMIGAVVVPSEITRWPIAAVTSDFIGVVMGVVIGVIISQTENLVAYRKAAFKRHHTQQTKGMGSCRQGVSHALF
ncbi:MAG: hypothetical protein JHD22_07695 [Ilumatobacteraceae bacterium]|nr:hypothetical protein [Ilumatobacteraceae bacterium]